MIATINNVVITLSIIGIFTGLIVLILDLFKRLVKKDKILLLMVLISSFLTRILWGSFGPWRQDQHYFEVFSLLKRNFLEGKILGVTDTYHASVGLFENFYNIPLQLFSEFNVYVIYYTSLTLMIFCGLLVFLLALNLFKNKKIAFISYLMFSFLPVLIKISASEIYFILNALTLLLFVNYLFYLKSKSNILYRHYILLLLLLFSNLVGRLEYLSLFPLLIFSTLFLFVIFNKDLRTYLKKDNKIKIVLSLFFLSSAFYFIYYIYPVGSSERELSFRMTKFMDFESHLKAFFYTSDNTYSHLVFLKYFFTPFYFFILTLISPIILILKKRWRILTVLGLTIPFVMFYSTTDFVDFRRVMPLVLLFIPVMSWSFYLILEKIKVPQKYIFGLAALVIIFSPIQNFEFLTTEIGRRVEQDFLIENLEKIPENSLILTIHDSSDGYLNHRYKEDGNEYIYTYVKAVFNTYLIPEKKNIMVMDIHKEYDQDIIDKHDNVFYYRGLYSYHERNSEFHLEDEKKKTPWQVTKEFEEKNKLKPIAEKKVKNSLYNIKTVEQFKAGHNFAINAVGFLKIGLYEIEFDK